MDYCNMYIKRARQKYAVTILNSLKNQANYTFLKVAP